MVDFLPIIISADIEASFLIIFNLILIESLLSIDNAAVLATMVMDLPQEQRGKALKYGIIGAYVFRGLCLLFAAWLVKILWLKALGGLYLIWLAYDYFKTKMTPKTEDDLLNKKDSKLYKATLGMFGPFWATVALVELMDLAFSIDNVFAAVAYTDNIYLIWTGVFIGILAMRFVAQSFVTLMERFPFLETIAFVVIGILGFKLTASFACDYANLTHAETPSFWGNVCSAINGHSGDLYISLLTTLMFVVPIIGSLLFNFPKRK